MIDKVIMGISPSPKARSRHRDDGYTLIEMLVVMIMTALLAGMFSQILISSINIYSGHNQRKTAAIDARRACDMLQRDVWEWRAWQNAPTSTTLDFTRINRYKAVILFFFTVYYYDDLRVGFNFTGDDLTYSRDDDGNWSNAYTIIQDGVNVGTSQFSTVTQGGTMRVTMQLVMTVNGKPMQLRTAAFPRQQGG